jgi:hypothetical protein
MEQYQLMRGRSFSSLIVICTYPLPCWSYMPLSECQLLCKISFILYLIIYYRVDVLNMFKNEDKCPALVCTDLAARGLDLVVDHVIMFDFPLNSVSKGLHFKCLKFWATYAQTYVHTIDFLSSFFFLFSLPDRLPPSHWSNCPDGC